MRASARRRSATVTLGVTALLATGLTACGNDEPEDPDYGAVCVDSQTQQRVDDDQCGDDYRGGGPGVGLFAWYFLSRGLVAPALGQRVAGGTFTAPATGTIRRGVNPGGGTIARGGFGGRSGSAGVGRSGGSGGSGSSGRSGG